MIPTTPDIISLLDKIIVYLVERK